MSPAFDTATAVQDAGDGGWAAESHRDWETPLGANGGYLAAVVLRAMARQLDDQAYEPRSLTVQFLRSPHTGPLRIEVEVVRSGRRTAQLTARGLQDDRVWGTALAVFGTAGTVDERFGTAMPQIPTAEGIEPLRLPVEFSPITHRVDMQQVVGDAPFSGSTQSRIGGWVRFTEPQPFDAPALAMLADAWLPAIFPRVTEPLFAPTLDYTVHFRNPPAARRIAIGESVLGIFTTDHAAEGYVEEDGELWSRDGVLLAQARQLALLVPGEVR
ncbi:unannotated protein [freshwater metagenome]|uniref:Unannotated protein n=1 Tax=freshwater metagenome TaxID=449393 RepID=A0A6J7J0N4_9ZZZZ|nr:hypothetical protein [Actinomycetota bacterium]